ISAIVVHTTGNTDLEAVLRFYQSPDGLQPHYVIALDGTIRRIAWEHRVAYHCKIDPTESRLYRLGYGEWSRWRWQDDRAVQLGDEFPAYRGWRDEWRAAGLESPLELATEQREHRYRVAPAWGARGGHLHRRAVSNAR